MELSGIISQDSRKKEKWSEHSSPDLLSIVYLSQPKILFISFFLYFLIVRKSVRTVMKENDGINGNKEISFGSSKKIAVLHFSVTCIYLYIHMKASSLPLLKNWFLIGCQSALSVRLTALDGNQTILHPLLKILCSVNLSIKSSFKKIKNSFISFIV